MGKGIIGVRQNNMQMQDIVKRIGSLPLCEKRELEDDYLELVFYIKDLVEWNLALIEFLGKTKKPAGVKPSLDDSSITTNFGGIYTNQTLYRKDLGNRVVIGMLWPWSDAEHVTLKLAFIEK